MDINKQLEEMTAEITAYIAAEAAKIDWAARRAEYEQSAEAKQTAAKIERLKVIQGIFNHTIKPI